jgi:hypothetical protein
VSRTGKILSEAAIHIMAAEPMAAGLELPRGFAEHIPAYSAHSAGEAGPVVIGHNPIPRLYPVHPLCHGYHLSGHLMALCKGEIGGPDARECPIVNMGIRPTDAAGTHPAEGVTRLWLRDIHLIYSYVTEGVQPGSLHSLWNGLSHGQYLLLKGIEHTCHQE